MASASPLVVTITTPLVAVGGEDVFQHVICSFLCIRDLGVFATVSKHSKTLIYDNIVWHVITNSYFRHSKLYNFFANQQLSLSTGSIRSEFALCVFKRFLSSHYALTPTYETPYIKPSMQILSSSWTSAYEGELLKSVSRSCKMHDEFFDNFNLGVVEGIVLLSICRRHCPIDPRAYHWNGNERAIDFRYDVLCNIHNKNGFEFGTNTQDYYDLHALRKISNYASDLRNSVNQLFDSVKLVISPNDALKIQNQFLRKLMTPIRCYKDMLQSVT